MSVFAFDTNAQLLEHFFNDAPRMARICHPGVPQSYPISRPSLPGDRRCTFRGDVPVESCIPTIDRW